MKLMNVFNKQLIYLNNSLIKFMSCCIGFMVVYIHVTLKRVLCSIEIKPYLLLLKKDSREFFFPYSLALSWSTMAIAFGRFDDSFSLGSFKAYLAEFISTLLFVFAGVGSAIAFSNLPSSFALKHIIKKLCCNINQP